MSREGYVLLGDIVSSKKIKDRAQFQEKLIRACNFINKHHKNEIIAKMKIIKGSDEIGCLLKNLAPLYNIIKEIGEILYPVKIRFVLVKGIIDTGFLTNDISRMDGPAFHRASELMNDLKKEKLILNISTSNNLGDALISNNINLIYLVKGRWSPTKREIIEAYERWGDQRKVASKLKITQQTVSYHLKSSNWKQIKKIEIKLNRSLKVMGTESNESGT